MCVSGFGGEAHVAGLGAVRAGGRVWATGLEVGREGQGVWGGVRVWCVGVRPPSQWCACVFSCTYGGLEVEAVVHRGCGEDLADACVYLVYLLVGGGKMVLQGLAEAHAPEDSVDSVVSAGEGLL